VTHPTHFHGVITEKIIRVKDPTLPYGAGSLQLSTFSVVQLPSFSQTQSFHTEQVSLCHDCGCAGLIFSQLVQKSKLSFGKAPPIPLFLAVTRGCYVKQRALLLPKSGWPTNPGSVFEHPLIERRGFRRALCAYVSFCFIAQIPEREFGTKSVLSCVSFLFFLSL